MPHIIDPFPRDAQPIATSKIDAFVTEIVNLQNQLDSLNDFEICYENSYNTLINQQKRVFKLLQNYCMSQGGMYGYYSTIESVIARYNKSMSNESIQK